MRVHFSSVEEQCIFYFPRSFYKVPYLRQPFGILLLMTFAPDIRFLQQYYGSFILLQVISYFSALASFYGISTLFLNVITVRIEGKWNGRYLGVSMFGERHLAIPFRPAFTGCSTNDSDSSMPLTQIPLLNIDLFINLALPTVASPGLWTVH